MGEPDNVRGLTDYVQAPVFSTAVAAWCYGSFTIQMSLIVNAHAAASAGRFRADLLYPGYGEFYFGWPAKRRERIMFRCLELVGKPQVMMPSPK